MCRHCSISKRKELYGYAGKDLGLMNPTGFKAFLTDAEKEHIIFHFSIADTKTQKLVEQLEERFSL